MLRRRTPLALLALLALGLSACTTFGYPGYPDNRRGPVYDRQGEYTRTTEYRSIGRDADRYTDLLDRELRLNGGQEQTIERILERRAQDLLRRTPPRDHRYVYPFPRDQRLSATARRWWDDTDREINRYLDPRQRDEYRYIARDLERYGRYDGRRYDQARREQDRRYEQDRRDDRYRRDRVDIPNGHLPPRGQCRVWYHDRPPGRQPSPQRCSALTGRYFPGAVVVDHTGRVVGGR